MAERDDSGSQKGCLAHWKVWEFLFVHTRAVLAALETMSVSLGLKYRFKRAQSGLVNVVGRCAPGRGSTLVSPLSRPNSAGEAAMGTGQPRQVWRLWRAALLPVEDIEDSVPLAGRWAPFAAVPGRPRCAAQAAAGGTT